MSGRRDRNKQDKRERILAAARELFAERGFSGVTTQQISERADVAAGTLFRYAATKGELILMVENDAFADAVAEGIERAHKVAGAAAAVFALVEPVLALAESNAENTTAYQRELLFGAADEPHRQDGLAIIARLEQAAARLIAEGAADPALVSSDPVAIPSAGVQPAGDLSVEVLPASTTASVSAASASVSLSAALASVAVSAASAPASLSAASASAASLSDVTAPAVLAARSVFAVLHLALVSASLTPDERTRSVRLQIQQIVRGVVA